MVEEDHRRMIHRYYAHVVILRQICPCMSFVGLSLGGVVFSLCLSLVIPHSLPWVASPLVGFPLSLPQTGTTFLVPHIWTSTRPGFFLVLFFFQFGVASSWLPLSDWISLLSVSSTSPDIQIQIFVIDVCVCCEFCSIFVGFSLVMGLDMSISSPLLQCYTCKKFL